MSKHLTDIEIFEFSNQLLDDKAQLVAINEHLTNCETCQLKVNEEMLFSKAIQSNLTVSEKIDVSEKVLSHFQTEIKPVFIDLKWTIYTSIIVAVIYMLSTIPNLIDVAFPKIENLNTFISAVFLILMVDVIVKYFRFRKSH
ncbi:MAG: hypothetical protein OQJ96_02585 [Flavobacteriales bacterium]|nr:hypothetical protein [Flavobacteriales bacterium]MCW8912811.1 hypothetical protein [Flavobacteriales bacterium]MCW8938815.1 hypothetical protein [Flavobacteriales bacterium]MCW8940891.1 hypothetical protein [Flavobacteriales bacterium]MCW8968525.1 hypothetical protein [Flavobacteriales bacterium]